MSKYFIAQKYQSVPKGSYREFDAIKSLSY